jgi:hypothetical protein
VSVQNETPPGMAGLAKIVPDENIREIAPNSAPAQAQIPRNPRAVHEAKLELLREAIHEACGFIQLHANVCQDLAEAGDDAGLIHSLGRLVVFTKDAARNGNDLRTIRDEAASSKEAGQ